MAVVETNRKESEATQSCLTLCDPMDCSLVGFSRQEYWSGLPFPSSQDLPEPRIEAESLAFAGRFFTTMPPGKTNFCCLYVKKKIMTVNFNRYYLLFVIFILFMGFSRQEY